MLREIKASEGEIRNLVWIGTGCRFPKEVLDRLFSPAVNIGFTMFDSVMRYRNKYLVYSHRLISPFHLTDAIASCSRESLELHMPRKNV